MKTARGYLLAMVLILIASALLQARDRDSRGDPIALRNWRVPARERVVEVRAEDGESRSTDGLPSTAEGSAPSRIGAMAVPSLPASFNSVSPCRVVDTRNADGPFGGPIMAGASSRSFTIPAGPCAGIPIAAAYSLNLAVTGSSAGAIQFLTAYPAGTTRPVVSTMNFDGGETTSNSAIVPASSTGSIEVFVTTDTHVIIDINGYFLENLPGNDQVLPPSLSGKALRRLF